MRIQHNIAAINANRQLSTNNTSIAKNLEKLSSGYAINRAGDDAAGLAISEKMRAQITGLGKAQDNANDGISLVQTAEGALTEVHSMLNRMTELATQSANGTYDDSTDRANLQEEVESLKSEINRIAESTNYNGISLLDGSLGDTVSTSGAVLDGTAVTGTTLAATTSAYTTDTIVAGAGAANTLTLTYTAEDGTSKNLTVNYTSSATPATNLSNIKDALSADESVSKLFDISANTGSTALVIKSKTTGADAATVTNLTTTGTNGLGATGTSVSGAGAGKSFDAADLEEGDSISIGGKTFFFTDTASSAPTDTVAVILGASDTATTTALQTAIDNAGITNVSVTYNATGGTGNAGALNVTSDGEGLTLQIGDTADSYNQLSVSVDNMSTSSLGIADIDISKQSGASAAIALIKTAINSVSSTRGDLGAVQNRLEYTINNLSVAEENITSAESRIRDTDMASEMMEYTKNNILIQASQSMLAQANQLPQGVLQLLQ